MLVHGESGVGKTCLVRTFTERLQAEHDGVLVLHGRCHEREVVPYKALDDVVDALSRRLARMPDDSVAALLPVWASALTHVFPVLRRAKVFAKEGDLRGDVDVQELRRRAFAALRELLRRLALRQPTVIVVDDLQWADADSLSLLAELLRQPDAPPILLVATVRTGDTSTATREQLPEVALAIPGDVRSMQVARLPQAEARELAEILVARAGGDASAASIAEEAAGHPLYIDELVRHTSAAREVRTWKLEEALWARVSDLPEDARRVVELVSVAEARLAQETIAHAASLDGAEFARTVSLLRAANLVRTRGVRGSDAIEAYHDRVREAVVGHLSAAELRARHELLALALEASTTSDPRALAIHWRGAGDRARAARYAIVAAEQATKALAFDRAAQWYELALELHGEHDPTRRALRVKLGDAHANAGRGARAAQEYQGAAEGANQAEALDLRRRAAEQLLRSGHFDRGIAATQEVLGLVDMHLPATPFRAIMALLFWRFVLWVRGLRYTERDATQVPARDLARIDTCWALGVGLALTDNVYGALFNTRTVILALRAGEPRRIARALGLEIGFSGSKGNAAWAHTQALMNRASVIAERTETPGLIAWVVGVTGVGHYLNGYYRRALELCDRAERQLRQEAAGQVWEVASVRLFAMNALGQLGDLREIRRRQPAQMREALERGDLFAAANLGIGFANLAWLAADDVDGARRGIERAMEHWSKRGFHLEHFYELLARVNVELYAGEGKV
ncbi:MAG TPA: AAA family ATPase, partial [Byssovorax sp.]